MTARFRSGTGATDAVRAVTTIVGGVSQGGLSWAPDSTRLVLGTRLVGAYREKVCDFEKDGMRVYDAQTPVNHLLQEGVFKLESRGGDLRKAIDCDPQLGISRIVIVNLQSNTWTEMKGTARQYSNPSWSTDGRFIAAIADLNDGLPQPTYFGQRDNHNGLSVFDVASGTERRMTVRRRASRGRRPGLPTASASCCWPNDIHQVRVSRASWCSR